MIPRLSLRLWIAIGATVAVGLLFSGMAWLLAGAWEARSLAIGVGLAALNLTVLGLALTAFFPASETHRVPSSAKPFWAALGLLKMIGIFVVFALLLKYDVASPISLVLGYVTLPLGIAVGSICSPHES